MKVWMLVAESVTMVGLWLTCLVMDLVISITLITVANVYTIDGVFLLFILILLHLVINGWFIRVSMRKCTILDFFLLLTLQIPFSLLIRGAWHGLQATCVQGERHKMRSALKGKFSVCYEMKSSSEKLPVEEREHREASCISSQNGEVPDIPEGETEAPRLALDAEQGTEAPVTILKTKFVGDSNKIELGPDNREDIYGGEPSVYKYTVRCLQALLADRKRLSYHFVTDSTNTRILHVSCTDKRIDSLPDQVISENPLVVCGDTHYILNLSSVNGYEVYEVTKRSGGVVTIFELRDLHKMIWLPIWPLAVVKIFDLLWKTLLSKTPTLPLMWVSMVVGVLTWLATQRALYHSITDRLLIAGHRISFYLVRTILLCCVSIFTSMLFIPICYLMAKAAGALFFTVYIAALKKARNVELFVGAFSKYTFYAMYDPVVQIGESLVYSAWAIYLYCSVQEAFLSHIMLMTIIGQSTGLVWILFARPRLRQLLHDPVRVLDIIKQMEYARS